MQIRKITEINEFIFRSGQLIKMILRDLNAENPKPLSQLHIIGDLQKMIVENYPNETEMVVAAINKNLYLFEGYQSIFSSDTIYDRVKTLGRLCFQRFNESNQALEVLMNYVFERNTKRLDQWIQRNDPKMLDQVYFGSNRGFYNKTVLDIILEKGTLEQLTWLLNAGVKIPLNKITANLFKQHFEGENIQKLAVLFQYLVKHNKISDVMNWINFHELYQVHSSKNHFTLLHLMAFSKWDSAYIVIVNALKNIDLHAKNKEGYTALDVAIMERNLPFVKELSRYLGPISDTTMYLAKQQKNINPETAEIYHMLKDPYKRKKHAIIDKKPFFITPIDQIKPPIKPLFVICSQVYYEGDSQHLTHTFIKQLAVFLDYKKAPLMAPLLYVVALAAIGKHSAGSRPGEAPKFLKMILTVDRNLSALSPDSWNVRGLFTRKSTLFTAVGDSSEAVMKHMSTIFHEATHFVALEIMQNECEPYQKSDINRKEKYKPVILKTKSNLEHILSKLKSSESIVDKKEQKCFINFYKVFTKYPKEQWGVELIVLFPQTISILGYEKGCQFLQTHFPEIMDYYVNDFYPRCIEYLNEKQAEQWLDLSPDFLSVLKESAEVSSVEITAPTPKK